MLVQPGVLSRSLFFFRNALRLQAAYPHVTLELVPLKGARDVSADWKKPLAVRGGARSKLNRTRIAAFTHSSIPSAFADGDKG
jgi:hypothetical protein